MSSTKPRTSTRGSAAGRDDGGAPDPTTSVRSAGEVCCRTGQTSRKYDALASALGG